MKIVSILTTTLLWTIIISQVAVRGDDHTTVSADEWVFGTSLDAREFVVGETITFEWTGTHDVHIHPSGDCTEDGRMEVGLASPATYTFTEEGTVVFACDVGSHCEDGGMILTANVMAAAGGDDTPTTAPVATGPDDSPDSGSIGYGLAVVTLAGLSVFWVL